MTTSPLAVRLDQARQLRRIVREVGVHLTDHVDRLANREFEAVDVRPPQPSILRPVQDGDTALVPARQFIGELARAVG